MAGISAVTKNIQTKVSCPTQRSTTEETSSEIKEKKNFSLLLEEQLKLTIKNLDLAETLIQTKNYKEAKALFTTIKEQLLFLKNNQVQINNPDIINEYIKKFDNQILAVKTATQDLIPSITTKDFRDLIKSSRNYTLTPAGAPTGTTAYQLIDNTGKILGYANSYYLFDPQGNAVGKRCEDKNQIVSLDGKRILGYLKDYGNLQDIAAVYPYGPTIDRKKCTKISHIVNDGNSPVFLNTRSYKYEDYLQVRKSLDKKEYLKFSRDELIEQLLIITSELGIGFPDIAEYFPSFIINDERPKIMDKEIRSTDFSFSLIFNTEINPFKTTFIVLDKNGKKITELHPSFSKSNHKSLNFSAFDIGQLEHGKEYTLLINGTSLDETPFSQGTTFSRPSNPYPESLSYSSGLQSPYSLWFSSNGDAVHKLKIFYLGQEIARGNYVPEGAKKIEAGHYLLEKEVNNQKYGKVLIEWHAILYEENKNAEEQFINALKDPSFQAAIVSSHTRLTRSIFSKHPFDEIGKALPDDSKKVLILEGCVSGPEFLDKIKKACGNKMIPATTEFYSGDWFFARDIYYGISEIAENKTWQKILYDKENFILPNSPKMDFYIDADNDGIPNAIDYKKSSPDPLAHKLFMAIIRAQGSKDDYEDLPYYDYHLIADGWFESEDKKAPNVMAEKVYSDYPYKAAYKIKVNQKLSGLNQTELQNVISKEFFGKILKGKNIE